MMTFRGVAAMTLSSALISINLIGAVRRGTRTMLQAKVATTFVLLATAPIHAQARQEKLVPPLPIFWPRRGRTRRMRHRACASIHVLQGPVEIPPGAPQFPDHPWQTRSTRRCAVSRPLFRASQAVIRPPRHREGR